MDRIATFRSFILEVPVGSVPSVRAGDGATRARGELAEAWTVFEELLAKFPDYVPTYLMAGGTLVALGRKDEAADDLSQGYRSCRSAAAISMLAASSSRPWPRSPG